MSAHRRSIRNARLLVALGVVLLLQSLWFGIAVVDNGWLTETPQSDEFSTWLMAIAFRGLTPLTAIAGFICLAIGGGRLLTPIFPPDASAHCQTCD